MLVLVAAIALTSPLTAQRRMGDPIGPAGQGRGPVSGAAARVETKNYHFNGTNKKIDYALFVSSKVRKDHPSPLVIALHGMNEPAERLARILADVAERAGYIVAAPTGYALDGWYGISARVAPNAKPANLAELSEQDVMNVLDLMRHDFNIDKERIYLAGSSMGGAGALYLGTKYHQIWAAVGAAAPAAGGLPMTILQSATDVPMILVQGLADESVQPAGTRRWADEMRRLNMTVEYDELPGVDHPNAIIVGASRMFQFFDRYTKSQK
jgi:poly(3-hydroxybutyrate) depolymerase